jgi:cysteine peptidase C11 family protein
MAATPTCQRVAWVNEYSKDRDMNELTIFFYIVSPAELETYSNYNLKYLVDAWNNPLEVHLNSSGLPSKAKIRLADEIKKVKKTEGLDVTEMNALEIRKAEEERTANIDLFSEHGFNPTKVNIAAAFVSKTRSELVICPQGGITHDTSTRSNFQKLVGRLSLKEFINVATLRLGVRQQVGCSKRYMFIISGHGFGFSAGDSLPTLAGLENFSGLSTLDLMWCMRRLKSITGKKLSYLVMDACLMQTAELCSGLADCVEHYFACQETIDSQGAFHYGKLVLELMKTKKKHDALTIIQTLFESLSEKNKGRTFSAVDLDQFLSQMVPLLNEFACRIRSVCTPKEINSLFERATHFSDSREAEHRTDLQSLLKLVDKEKQRFCSCPCSPELMTVTKRLGSTLLSCLHKGAPNERASVSIYTGRTNLQIMAALHAVGLTEWGKLLSYTFAT